MSLPPTPRPPRTRAVSETRDSVLRASILESALELGVGTNRTVAHWIFNPVEEGDEGAESETPRYLATGRKHRAIQCAPISHLVVGLSHSSTPFCNRCGVDAKIRIVKDVVSPSLTYASTATSDESFPPNFASRTQPGAGILVPQQTSGKAPGPESSASLGPMYVYSPRDGLRAGAGSPEAAQRIQFDLSKSPELRAVSPLPWKNKLRKARPSGYESDGNTGDGSKKGKDKKSKKKEKEKDGAATDHESDGGYLSEASVKKTKGKRTKEKKEKEKAGADSPTADYDTDGHTSKTSSPRSKKDQRSRKTSALSPGAGDESDGGYVSEASGKKRSFFRLNSRSSRKRRDSDSPKSPPVPPVPALPAMLPIAGRFLQSSTDSLDSRSATPVPSQYTTASERESSETYRSFSTLSPHDDRESAMSIISQEGLVRAFRDTESVRRPSIDALSTFHHLGAPTTSVNARSTSPLSQSHPYAREHINSSPEPPTDVPIIALPKNKGARPMISAPNTSMLSPKHVPVPLMLSGASSISIHSQVGDIVPSPDPDYIFITPTAAAFRGASPGGGVQPSSDYLVPSPVPPISPTAQTGIRPHVQAFYDLPPPTPPPRGPLPDVPSPIIPRESPESRFPPRALTPEPERPIAGIPRSPTMPLASPQRGRVSPFPVAPVLSRRPSVTTPIPRIDGPFSADAYRPRDNLAADWQPRSASVLERRVPRVRFADEEEEEEDAALLDDRSLYQSADDDASYYPDEDGRNSHFYADAAKDKGDRSSMWSATESRLSFMDNEKSAAARERFMRGVEELYGPEIIPPVPRLSPTARNG